MASLYAPLAFTTTAQLVATSVGAPLPARAGVLRPAATATPSVAPTATTRPRTCMVPPPAAFSPVASAVGWESSASRCTGTEGVFGESLARSGGCVVPPAGFEPAHTAPEADALSPELRGPGRSRPY